MIVNGVAGPLVQPPHVVRRAPVLRVHRVGRRGHRVRARRSHAPGPRARAPARLHAHGPAPLRQGDLRRGNSPPGCSPFFIIGIMTAQIA